MRNQVFVHGFLFDFYSVRGSTATPSGRSNVRWCGLGIFSARNGVVQFLSFFSKFDRSWNKNEKSDCSDFRNPRRTADVVFKVNEKLSECWRITPLGSVKHANFLKIDKFKRRSLTHITTQGHQIFSFAKQIGALVDNQDLARSLKNWGRYCELNFEKSQKFVKIWGP